MVQNSVGERLRQSRLAQKLDLTEIAESSKISKFYLEAIETDQIERLPGLFFYKAFVRQYAEFLNVDSADLIAQISSSHGEAGVTVAELRQTTKPVTQHAALRAANDVRPDTRFMLAAAGLIVVLMGGSFVYTWMQRPSTPVDVAVAAAAGTIRPVPQGQPGGAARPQAGFPSENPSLVQRVSENLTPNADPNSPVILSLSAVEPTWLTISSDGRTIYSGILEPLQSKQLAGNSSVVIRVGNAAGLDVKWNGKAVGKLGDPKQVRTILFTDKEFQILKPAPPPPPPSPVL
jgi:cytoskeleton protein RodZ